MQTFRLSLISTLPAIIAVVITCSAQRQAPADYGALIDQALQESSLSHSNKPFHLLLQIHPGKVLFPGHEASPEMSGSMEVFWTSARRYKLVLKSPSFSQTKIVDGDKLEEHDEGDFYPRWFDDFVRAFFDPLPQMAEFRVSKIRMTGGGTFIVPGKGPKTMPRCIEKSDRPGGVTEETSIARVCFDASHDWVQGGLDFTRYVSFSDYRPFGGQQIPRRWSDDIPENIFVEGDVVKLETLSREDSQQIQVQTPTPASGQIRTVFLSRSKIDDLREPLPDYRWPNENTETLEGYMIVYIRTDREGNIRESYWSSSDNYKLQDAGVKLAKMAKLKPFLVDGVPVQVEGPMVLHFKTQRDVSAPQ